MKKLFLLFATFGLIQSILAQDNIRLNTGMHLEGKIQSVNDSTISFRDSKSGIIYKWDLKNVVYYTNLEKDTTVFPSAQTTEERQSQQELFQPVIKTAGDELVICMHHIYTGLILSASGGIVSSLSFLPKDDKLQKEIFIGGAVISLAGMILGIEAYSHLGKAGRKLNATIGKSGLGLTLKL